MYVFRIVLYSIVLSKAWSTLELEYLDAAKNPYFEENQYPYENHTIVTKDGYILLLVRLFNKGNTDSNKTKPPMLFVHGNGDMFFTYLITGPGVALGFKALEAGYDTFFLNTRGNKFSSTHLTLDPRKDAEKYWNFSVHENGMYDVPAAIDFVTNLTGASNISYVGHSQGGGSFLVMTSTKPEYNKYIRLAVLLGPAAYLDHASFVVLSIGKYIIPFSEALSIIFHAYGVIFSSNLANFLRVICNPNFALSPVCEVVYWIVGGPTTQYNKSIFWAALDNIPTGISVKHWLHYQQIAKSKRFQFYDYGEIGNLVQYGESTAPDYNLSAVTSPVALYYGDSDIIAAPEDVKRLAKDLPNLVEDVLIPYIKTNHLDIILGRYAKQYVNEPIMNLFNKYNDL